MRARCAGVRATPATDPGAHAHFIVLTENAVGFENGGQCVPSDWKTNTLYVSTDAAHGRRNRVARRRKTSRGPCTVGAFASLAFLNSCTCCWRRGEKNMGAFPGFVTAWRYTAPNSDCPLRKRRCELRTPQIAPSAQPWSMAEPRASLLTSRGTVFEQSPPPLRPPRASSRRATWLARNLLTSLACK